MHPYTRALLSAIPEPDPFKEKNRKKLYYDPAKYRVESDQRPTYHEVAPGHTVYCTDRELEIFQRELNEEHGR